MKLICLPYELSVLKVSDLSQVDLGMEFFFIARTDDELSVVCPTSNAHEITDQVVCEDGWKGFKIDGILDFGLIGILSKISGILAEAKIGIFAVSTYNTDYILVKQENFARASETLAAAGYEVTGM